MAPPSPLLAALGETPVSTSDLYTQVGYPTLVALGLVSYDAFRGELAKLAKAGLADCDTAQDGATRWWRL